MRDFFRGWRFKIGCLTLLAALVFMSGWVRSLIVYDCAIFHCGLHTKHTVFSESHLIGYQYIYERLPQHSNLFLQTNWGSNTPADALDHLLADNRITWYWRWCGFSDCEYEEFKLNGCRCRIWIVPYWSIVIPLKLFSACLLLSKPRNEIQKKIVEPATADGR